MQRRRITPRCATALLIIVNCITRRNYGRGVNELLIAITPRKREREIERVGGEEKKEQVRKTNNCVWKAILHVVTDCNATGSQPSH